MLATPKGDEGDMRMVEGDMRVVCDSSYSIEGRSRNLNGGTSVCLYVGFVSWTILLNRRDFALFIFQCGRFCYIRLTCVVPTGISG